MSKPDVLKQNPVSALILIFGVLLVCLLWGGLYVKIQQERGQELAQAARETAGDARAFAEHTLRTLRGMDQIALILKHRVETEGWDIDISSMVAAGRFAAQPFVLLMVVDADGRIVDSSEGAIFIANVKDRDYFAVHQAADSQQLYVSKPLTERLSGKMVIQLSRRINRPDGSFGGVAVVAVDPYYFAEFYKGINLEKGASVTLLGRDGIVRIRQVDADIRIGMDFSQRLVQEMTGEAGTYTAVGVVDGIRRIYSYRALAEYPLIVAVGKTEAQALQGLYQRLGSYYWVCGLLSVLIGLFVTALLVSMARRRQLEAAYTHGLERAVEERTQDLNAANQELTAANEELTALNEEVLAMNESLAGLNHSLSAEVEARQHKEAELLRRGKQYRAIASLLTRPDGDYDDLLKTILTAAVELVGAPGGEIAQLDDSGTHFTVSHAIGIRSHIERGPRPADQGMIGEVYRSGELLCIEDYRQYPGRVYRPWNHSLTTVVMTPLKVGNAVKGFLSATWHDAVQPVKPEDSEDFRQFGDLAAIVLERAHSHDQIAYKNQLLQKLTETTLALVNELDLEKALRQILNEAAAFMGIPHGFIQLFEPDRKRAALKCGIGRYQSRVGTFTQFDDKGIYAEILRTGKSVVVNDYQNWPGRLVNEFTRDITAAMQVPLNIEGKTIGSIGLTVCQENITINWNKMAVFEQFAAVAAIAVKNALEHQRTKHLALHDTLTGLPNRAQLRQHLDAELGLAQSGQSAGAVMFIDLDDLKTVNDHFGHSSGDAVIITASEDIVRAAGADAFIARVGGDEFVVVLPGKDSPADSAQMADRILQTIHKEYEIKGQTIQMSASVGVTRYPLDGTAAEEILKNADAAMYAAKAAGRNCWRLYEETMLKGPYETMVLTNSLRHALERGELQLHYQPLVAVAAQTIVGFEALLRWNGPEHGSVPPARFIPLAEQSGLILPIGNWVVDEACRFARVLAERGRQELYVSVNVSPRQLAASDFVDNMRRSLAAAGAGPSQLMLEVTESVLIDSLEDSTAKLAELSSQGIQLALDDFGTGFSSLTYLRNLPAGILKIDKSFIDRMQGDAAQVGFVRSIIAMAHQLELQVVAEGVETAAQFAQLAELGCDYAQGYWFSRPVPPADALRLL